MKSINLIPTPRLDARRRRTHRRRCVAACAAYGAVVLAAGAACQAVLNGAAPDVTDKLADATGRIEQAERDLVAVRADLEMAKSTLRASRSIVEQPDWSTLLALLAAKAGNPIVLKACQVRPRDPAPAPAAPPKPGAKAAPAAPPAEPVMVVAVSGRGRTQLEVSQFILRLESTRLFGNVRLLDTGRETFEKGESIAFRLECSLDEPAKPVGVAMLTTMPTTVPTTMPAMPAAADPAIAQARDVPLAAPARPVLPSVTASTPARRTAATGPGRAGPAAQADLSEPGGARP